MATHILDLTAVADSDFPPGWPVGVRTLPIVAGQHYYDWDLVRQEIDRTTYRQLVRMIKGGWMPKGDERMPIGFRLNVLPKGAVIRPIQ